MSIPTGLALYDLHRALRYRTFDQLFDVLDAISSITDVLRIKAPNRKPDVTFSLLFGIKIFIGSHIDGIAIDKNFIRIARYYLLFSAIILKDPF